MTDAQEVQRLNTLRGGAVLALDGEIGAIKDFYFDDDTWTVRHLVVDTGKWLRGRLVLLPVWALHAPDWQQASSVTRVSWLERVVEVSLAREAVARSPAPTAP